MVAPPFESGNSHISPYLNYHNRSSNLLLIGIPSISAMVMHPLLTSMCNTIEAN